MIHTSSCSYIEETRKHCGRNIRQQKYKYGIVGGDTENNLLLGKLREALKVKGFHSKGNKDKYFQ